MRVSKSAFIVLLLFAAISVAWAQTAKAPSALPLVTDQMNLPLSDQFTYPTNFIVTNSGEVYFVASSYALFRWAGASPLARLLQTSGEHPGLPGSVNDLVAQNLAANSAGHLAMLNFFFMKDTFNNRGVFVYDGAQFKSVVNRGDVLQGTGGLTFVQSGTLRINASDQVAFIGYTEPLGVLGTPGLYLGGPGKAPIKIAIVGEPIPNIEGATYAAPLSLLALSDDGTVFFSANVKYLDNTTRFAVFTGTTAGISKVLASGDDALDQSTASPAVLGKFSLRTGAGNYMVNANGDLAFCTGISGGQSWEGIWIRSASGSLLKLVVSNDQTSVPAETAPRNFGGAITLRGFTNSGKVLFSSNVGGGATHTLFLKGVASEQIVFYRGQGAPGGAGTFLSTAQAAVNNYGQVAFLANLEGGGGPLGWFAWTDGVQRKIAVQGDPVLGGTLGLAGEPVNARINDNGQVGFYADILGPNATGILLWSPPSAGGEAGSLVSVMNTSDRLPPGFATLIRQFSPPASDDRVFFQASRAGGRNTVLSKPLRPGGAITRIVGEGDPAPGGFGGALWALSPVYCVNDNEEIALMSNWVLGAASGYPTASIIFTHRPGYGLRKVAATGDPAPGTAGGTFKDFDTSSLRPPARINAAGQVAFGANIAGSASSSGIFLGSASQGVRSVARMGELSPLGKDWDSLVRRFAALPFGNTVYSLNDAGQVAFRMDSVWSTPSGTLTAPAVFVGNGDSVEVLVEPGTMAVQGDQWPDGLTVASIPSSFQINNQGRVAYVAGLSGDAPQGVFLGAVNTPPAVIALAGQSAPGTEGSFSGFRPADLELNNAGQVAFRADIEGDTATVGLFLGSAGSEPQARLLQGQELPWGGTASYTGVGINYMGETFALADSGELCIWARDLAPGSGGGHMVIADANGVLRKFIDNYDRAEGTGSYFGGIIQAMSVNSSGRFFMNAALVDGPTKWAIFWNGTAKP